MRARGLASVVLVVAGAAHAQHSVLADTFEGRSDVFTGSPWGYVFSGEGVIALSPLAAHRGDAGLRLIDTTANAGSDVGSKLDNPDLGVAPAASWARMWMRVVQVDQADDVIVLQLGRGGTGPAGRQQQIFVNGYEVASDGFVAGGLVTTLRYPLDAGWHLLELGWEGVGTSAGARELFVDGAPVGRDEGLDFSWPQTLQELNVGETYADLPFRGVIDFDDVRLSYAPPASRLTLAPGSGQLTVGRCSTVTLVLTDSHGQVVDGGAPTALKAGFALEGLPGAGCDGGVLDIAEGEAGPWQVGVLALDAGDGVLVIAPDDLVAVRARVSATSSAAGGGMTGAGGGTGETGGGSGGSSGGAGGSAGGAAAPGRYAAGCVCGAASDAAWLLPLLAALRLRRARRA